MRNIPKVLPCISFGKRMPAVSTVLIRVERFDPFSLVILGLEELRFRMEKVPVIFGAFVESLIIGILVQFCSQLGNTPVIKSLLQSDGDRLSPKSSPYPGSISTPGLPSSAFARHYLRNLV